MGMDNIIRYTVTKAGGPTKVGRVFGLSDAAIHRWMRANRLPRTEFTGETAYAKTLAELANDPAITSEMLMQVGYPKKTA